MKNVLCLLLLSFSVYRIKCQNMESIESTVQKKPGETLTLSCRGSGFSFGCCSMHWIRQAGKPLVWIGRVYSDGSGHDYAESFNRRTEITRDNSKNMVYLKLSGLTAEDSATYYCAKQIKLLGRYAFDYWGKGTRVIVSNEDPKPPEVFMVSSCEPSSDSLIVGCLASGYSPAESVSFKWMDRSGKALTDFIQYPSGNTALTVSHITISKTKLNQSEIMCTAEHPLKPVNKTFRKVRIQTPTLSLVPVITPKRTSVMCVIEDFYPRMLSVQWKVNDKSTGQLNLESKQNEDTGFFRGYSFYEVSSETWNTNRSYTCEVTHNKGKPIHVTKNFKAKFTLTLKPPIQRELFVKNTIVLEAIVSGDVKTTVQGASVSCTVNNEAVTSQNIIPGNVFIDNSLFIRIHNVIIDTKKWFDGEMVTCTIRDTSNNKDIKQEIHFGKGDGQIPSVVIYRPDNNNNNSTVSVVCEVTSPKLGDVYLMWKVSEGKKVLPSYKEGRTSAPILRENSTSVLSILTMKKNEYEDHQTTITCAVMHANMTNIKAPLEVSTSKSKQQECHDHTS